MILLFLTLTLLYQGSHAEYCTLYDSIYYSSFYGSYYSSYSEYCEYGCCGSGYSTYCCSSSSYYSESTYDYSGSSYDYSHSSWSVEATAATVFGSIIGLCVLISIIRAIMTACTKSGSHGRVVQPAQYPRNNQGVFAVSTGMHATAQQGMPPPAYSGPGMSNPPAPPLYTVPGQPQPTGPGKTG